MGTSPGTEPSAPELVGTPDDVDFFERMDNHMPRVFLRVMRHLPSEPRCRLCNAPYGGIGGRIMRRVGFGPSRKNPSICNTCFEMAPLGGVEMEIGVLFADVRGFTSLSETLAPPELASLLNRFYACATRILARSAVIDKLVGDEVMALYIPQLIGKRWEDELVRDARELLVAVGFDSDGDPWLPVGIGLDIGRAFVGNVGSGEVKDFTALGDVVNTASRLQAAATAGQIVLSERLFARLSAPPPARTPELVQLRGKQQAEPVRVLDLS